MRKDKVLKILHITNWYPSKVCPSSAPWIKRQIDSLPRSEVVNKIYHVEVKKGKFSFIGGLNDDGSRYLILSLPFEIWKIYEWFSFCMVIWVLIKETKQQYDILNFHIAYPNLTFFKILRTYINSPIVITEHWSAYHFGFGVEDKKKLEPIRRIFRNGIPIIAVSESLMYDIKNFSNSEFPAFIIPNVVDTETFYYRQNGSGVEKPATLSFFMVSQWKWPKNPFVVIRAWPSLLKKHQGAKLRIGGYGPQEKEMMGLVSILGLNEEIKFIGLMEPEQVAEEMNRATAFIHCTEYETFSVVCAEALCCGSPVIASDVGAISEVVQTGHGHLFDANSEDCVAESIEKLLQDGERLQREVISKNSIDRFSSKKVGEKYFEALKQIIDEKSA